MTSSEPNASVLQVLSAAALASMRRVFESYPNVTKVLLFGSRAKGTHRPESDVDLALVGKCTRLQAARIGFELEELPLPYRFDVQVLSVIDSQPLREHIERVGVAIYER